MSLKKSRFKLIILSILLLFSFGGFSQSLSVIDSLKKAISESKGKIKTGLVIDLAVEYAENDIDKALNFLDGAYTRSLKEGDSTNIVRSGWIQSELWRRKDLLDEALNRLQYILPIAERNGNRKYLKKTLNSLAIVSTEKANYDSALSYNFKSLKLREEDGEKAKMSISCNNIGLIYQRINNFELALSFYNKSLQLKLESGDLYDIERLYINIGFCHLHFGEYKKAKECFSKSLTPCKNEECDPAIGCRAELGFAQIYHNIGELDVAEVHYKKSLTASMTLGDKKLQADALLGLSEVTFDLNNFEQSKEYLSSSYEIMKTTYQKRKLMSIYSQFAKLANHDKDYEKAVNFRKLYFALEDSVYSESMIKNLATVRANYSELENLATVEGDKQVIEQRKSLVFAVLAIGVLLLFNALVFYRYKHKIG
jgi:tetratricopeptide (TPR) repeat protein